MKRAQDRCEYCRLPARLVPLVPFHIEHIVPKQHGGTDDPENLAASCLRCNLSKGTNLVGFDRQTGKLVRLFDPRRQQWGRHFRWEGPVLIGRTHVGRATIVVLHMNDPKRIELREQLMAEGVFPPK